MIYHSSTVSYSFCLFCFILCNYNKLMAFPISQLFLCCCVSPFSCFQHISVRYVLVIVSVICLYFISHDFSQSHCHSSSISCFHYVLCFWLFLPLQFLSLLCALLSVVSRICFLISALLLVSLLGSCYLDFYTNYVPKTYN